MLWTLPLLPILAGALLWALGPRRLVLGLAAVGTLLILAGLAAWAAVALPTASFGWGGPLRLTLAVDPMVRVGALLVPVIAAPVVAWAAAHEAADGLPRLVGLLVAFAGAMELLVLAADLLTLTLGWELVGALSWALIGHRWRDAEASSSAAYAFNATRLGGLGLFVAAGAALATTGSLAFADLGRVDGPWRDALVAGLLVAAASKSAQVPFSPWLFRAMAGPSSVSALLHSSTMVAAGAWLLIRLHAPLSAAPWFGPAAISLGLLTAWAGGLSACVQPHSKRLLAASTSAHYGLIFAAVGAGAAGAGMAHLVTHAAFKALLFLAAGTAMGAVGSGQLRHMRLGRALPVAAAASAVGALALAAVPPLGGAWSKEQVVAATGHVSPVLAVLTIGAGALSAWYAARFHLLAFGRRGDSPDRPLEHPPGLAERAALWLLAALSLALGLLWLPGAHGVVDRLLGVTLPEGKTWELIASVVVVLAAVSAVWLLDRRGRLVAPERHSVVADWLGLPAAIDRLVTRPTLDFARACAAFDDAVVDAGVRGAAAFGRALSRLGSRALERGVDGTVHALADLGLLAADSSRRTDDRHVDGAVDGLSRGVGRAGSTSRKAQDGAVPTYYAILTIGLGLLALLLALWR